MREIAVVMSRELKSYFISPIAYVFGTLFLGFMMFMSSGIFGDKIPLTTAGGFFGLLPLVFLFLLPALTMRTWSEERKLGTLELLMTFPVRVSQLIFGKFFAALAYLSVLLLLTLIFPITLAIYGDLDWWPVIAAYLAAILMASAYLSVGMFWSSVTRDQIIALLLSLSTLLILYALGLPIVLHLLSQSWVPDSFVNLLAGISPYRYFASIARGVFDSRDMIYYICFCGFFLYANALVLNARRVRG